MPGNKNETMEWSAIEMNNTSKNAAWISKDTHHECIGVNNYSCEFPSSIIMNFAELGTKPRR